MSAADSKDFLTILTCKDKGRKATKEFFVEKDSTIKKQSYSAGMHFTHEEKHVSCLEDLKNVLESMLDKPKQFVIRGAAKESAGKVVERKIYNHGAAFNPTSHHYVMLDIDKQPCPAYFDAVENPLEIVKWAQEMLPAPFRETSCYYKFSSSQNIPKKIGESPSQEISLHLWFWCDRLVSDDEWKRFFKENPCPVDQALFSPVQIHYTSNPIFRGMDDPLPNRSGFFRGNRDIAFIPEIPAQEERKSKARPKEEPVIIQENCDKALDLLLPYYKEGTRDRFCGAIAGALYRGGWKAENTADFVYQLADTAADSESDARYNGSLRICDAIDHGRPAQGLPTLQDEIGVENLDEILTLLGIGKPDIKEAISKLFGVSELSEIKEVIKMITYLSTAEQKSTIDQIHTLTKRPKTVLNELLKEVKNEAKTTQPMDWSDYMMELFLEEKFKSGQNLLRSCEGSYWQYNGKYWEPAPTDFLKKEMIPYAREIVAASETKTASSLIRDALNLLEGRVYRENDPLRQLDLNIPTVINCQNGELWFNEAGDVALKPHRAESYLRYCLNVAYDPSAKSPMFDKAVLEIFSQSTNPEDMFRHFMELIGYICQPWRKLAIIVLLYGGGNNGKTSLIKMVIQILGEKMVMSDRISAIETSAFKIGALDGKLMLLDDDVDEGTCLPDGFLKKISEEKTMSGEHKYKPLFEFTCRAVPVMLANAYPSIKDLTEGIRRRVMVIPFLRKFETHEVKVGLFDSIWRQESSGILNQVIAGFQRLKKRGKFQEPEDCVKAKTEWLTRSNILPAFIEDVCEKGENLRQHLKDFYAEFKDYCNEAGVKNIPSRSGVEKRLESLGYKITILNGHKTVRGIIARSPSFLTNTKPEINLREKNK